MSCIIYGLDTVVSVLFKNTRTRWRHTERDIFNTFNIQSEYTASDHRLNELQTIMFENKECSST